MRLLPKKTRIALNYIINCAIIRVDRMTLNASAERNIILRLRELRYKTLMLLLKHIKRCMRTSSKT